MPPGCTVHVRGQQLFQSISSGMLDSIADVKLRNDQDYVEAFKERLDKAVRANLRGCRPPCATITGGLDSSSIAVTAADILAASGNQIEHIHSGARGWIRAEDHAAVFVETQYVRQIAELNQNIVTHYITQSSDRTPENIAETNRVIELPAATLNDLWGFDIFAAARSAGHTVMLTGEMGNLALAMKPGAYLKLLTGATG